MLGSDPVTTQRTESRMPQSLAASAIAPFAGTDVAPRPTPTGGNGWPSSMGGWCATPSRRRRSIAPVRGRGSVIPWCSRSPRGPNASLVSEPGPSRCPGSPTGGGPTSTSPNRTSRCASGATAGQRRSTRPGSLPSSIPVRVSRPSMSPTRSPSALTCRWRDSPARAVPLLRLLGTAAARGAPGQ